VATTRTVTIRNPNSGQTAAPKFVVTLVSELRHSCGCRAATPCQFPPGDPYA
jgi:hypothetical protein